MDKFSKRKSDMFDSFKNWPQGLITSTILVGKIRTDNIKEFESSKFISLWTHEYSTSKSFQQNGISKIKNRNLQEMARIMLTSKNI